MRDLGAIPNLDVEEALLVLAERFGFVTQPWSSSRWEKCVYFARTGLALKIGQSYDPRARCRDLTRVTGRAHRLALVVRGCTENHHEREFHGFLAGEQLGHEVFRGPRTELLLAELAAAAVQLRREAA